MNRTLKNIPETQEVEDNNANVPLENAIEEIEDNNANVTQLTSEQCSLMIRFRRFISKESDKEVLDGKDPESVKKEVLKMLEMFIPGFNREKEHNASGMLLLYDNHMFESVISYLCRRWEYMVKCKNETESKDLWERFNQNHIRVGRTHHLYDFARTPRWNNLGDFVPSESLAFEKMHNVMVTLNLAKVHQQILEPGEGVPTSHRAVEKIEQLNAFQYYQQRHLTFTARVIVCLPERVLEITLARYKPPFDLKRLAKSVTLNSGERWPIRAIYKYNSDPTAFTWTICLYMMPFPAKSGKMDKCGICKEIPTWYTYGCVCRYSECGCQLRRTQNRIRKYYKDSGYMCKCHPSQFEPVNSEVAEAERLIWQGKIKLESINFFVDGLAKGWKYEDTRDYNHWERKENNRLRYQDNLTSLGTSLSLRSDVKEIPRLPYLQKKTLDEAEKLCQRWEDEHPEKLKGWWYPPEEVTVVKEQMLSRATAAAADKVLATPEISQLIQQTTATMKDLQTASNKASTVLNSMPDLATKAEKAADGIASLTGCVQGFLDNISNIVGKYAGKFGITAGSCARIALILFEAFTDHSMITIQKVSFYALRFITEFNFIPLYDKFCAWLTSRKVASTQHETGATEVKEQGLSDLLSIPHIIYATISACFGGHAKDEWVLRIINAARFVNAVNQCRKTISGVIEFILEHLPEWLTTYFKFLKPKINWTKEAATGHLHQYSVFAGYISQMQMDGQMVPLKVWADHDKLVSAIEGDIITHGNIPPSINIWFHNTKKRLEAMRFSTEERKSEPFVIYVSGPPGVGKTTLSEILACALTKVPHDKVRDIIYHRVTGSEYFDGYKGKHQVVIYDDFFQDRAEGLDVLEVMQIVSNTQYRLNMSDLTGTSGAGKKGELYCSPYLILLSNTEYPQSSVINHNNALHRRRHLFVSMKVEGNIRDIQNWRFKVERPVQVQKSEADLWYPDDTWYGVKLGTNGGIQFLLSAVQLAYTTFVAEKQRVTTAISNCIDDLVFNGKLPTTSVTRRLEPPTFMPSEDLTPDFYKKYLKQQYAPVELPTAKVTFDALKNEVSMGYDKLFVHSQADDNETDIPENKELGDSLDEELQDAEFDFVQTFMPYSPADWKKRVPGPDGVGLERQRRVDEYFKGVERTIEESGKTAVPEKVLCLYTRYRDIESRYKKEQDEEKKRKLKEDVDREIFTALNDMHLVHGLYVNPSKFRERYEKQFSVMMEKYPVPFCQWQMRDKALKMYMKKADEYKQVLSDSFESSLENTFWAKFYNGAKWFGMMGAWALAFAGVAGILYVVKRAFFPSTKVDEQMSGSQETNRARVPRIRAPHKPISVVQQDSGQAMCELSKAIPRIRVCNLRTGAQICATPVRGRIVLMNKHFWDKLDQDDELEISISNGIMVRVLVEDCDVVQIEYSKTDNGIRLGKERDMVLVEFPTRMPCLRDCLSLFIKDEDLTFMHSGPLVMLAYRDGIKSDVCASYRRITSPLVHGPGGRYGTAEAWEYKALTLDGDCGSPLMLGTQRQSRFLMGCHFASSFDYNNTAYGTVVTQEQLQQSLDAMKQQIIGVCEQQLMPTIPIPEGMRQPDGNFNVVGLLAKGKPHLATQTSIAPSVFFEAFGEHLTEPAVLRKTDKRLTVENFDPVIDGVNKYGGQCAVIPEKIIHEIADSIIESINEARERCVPTECWKIFTRDEAIIGVPQLPHCEGIDMSTSPGYPYNQKYKKKDLITIDEKRTKADIHPILKTALDRREENAKQRKRVPSYWIDTLKDERRPLCKIYGPKPKTRVFTNPPCDLTILGKQYFGSFSMMMYQIRHRCFSAVGMNPYSKEWAEMIDYLREAGDYAFDLDHENFDGKFIPELFKIIFLVVEYFYEAEMKELLRAHGATSYEEERNVRETLLNELPTKYAIANGILYQTACGMPSGCWLTAIFNSIGNEAYMRWTWIRITSSVFLAYRDLKYYREYVRTKVFGDDGVPSVSRVARPFYNRESVFAEFASIGLIATRARKALIGTEVTEDDTDVLKCSFLKNTTGILRGQYVAQLDMATITEMVYWYRQSDWVNEQQAIEQTVNSALHFMYFYGRQRYDEYVNTLRKIAVQRRFPITLHSFNYLDAAYCSKGAFFDMDSLLHFTKGGTDLPDPQLVHQQSKEGSRDFRNQIMASNTSNSNKMAGQEAQNTGDQGRADAVTVDTRVGVSMVEVSRPQMSTYGEGKNTSADGRAQGTMNERPWNLEKMLGRHTYVEDIEWSKDTPSGTVLRAWSVPHDLLLNEITTTAFNRFRFFRGKLRLRFQTNGLKFALGRAIAWFVPYTSKAVCDIYQVVDPNNWTALHHVFIDPTISGVVTLEVPFIYPFSWLDLPNNEALGMVYLCVYNQLGLADALTTTTATIQCYFEVVDPQFKVPVISSVEPAATRVRQQAFEGLGTGLGKALDGIIKEAIPTEVKGDPIDMIAGVMGMDNPNVARNPVVALIRNEQYLTYADGVQNFQRLQLYPGALTKCDAEHFVSEHDEMSMSYLLQNKLCRLSTMNWSTSTAKGKILYECPVGPLMLGNITRGTAHRTLHPTLLDYISAKFSYWMGGIVFTVDGVLSQFHTGRLGFSFYPGLSAGDAPAESDTNFLQKAMSGYYTILDAKDGVLHGKLICPFLSPTPWKPIWQGSPNGDYATACSSGWMQLWVLTPLKANDTVPNTVALNLLVHAGNDFKLNILAGNNSGLFGSCPALEATVVREQSGYRAVQTGGQKDLNQTVFKKGVGVDDLPQLTTGEQGATTVATERASAYQGGQAKHFEEGYDSIRDIMKRFTYSGSKSGHFTTIPAAAASGELPLCVSYDPLEDLMAETANSGLITYFARMYRFFRGSIRQKIRVHAFDSNYKNYPIRRVKVTITPPQVIYLATGTDNGYPFFSDINNLSQAAQGSNPYATMTYEHNAIEVEFPYMHFINMLPTNNVEGERTTDVLPYRSFGRAIVEISFAPFVFPVEAGGLTVVLETFSAIGDDARFGGFMGVPWWSVNATLVGGDLPNSDWIVAALKSKSDTKSKDEDFVVLNKQIPPPAKELLSPRAVGLTVPFGRNSRK